MSAHVLLNLLNRLRKSDKMRGLPPTKKIPFNCILLGSFVIFPK